MQQGINTEEVKKYNASLREYKEKSTKLRAEMEFNEKELQRQCSELSTELGVTVTPDNIKAILEERISKINNTMTIGNEIMNRIKQEEAGQVSFSTPQAVTQQTAPVTTQMPQAPIPQAPVQPAATEPVIPGFPDISGGLPPIFAQGQSSITI